MQVERWLIYIGADRPCKSRCATKQNERKWWNRSGLNKVHISMRRNICRWKWRIWPEMRWDEMRWDEMRKSLKISAGCGWNETNEHTVEWRVEGEAGNGVACGVSEWGNEGNEWRLLACWGSSRTYLQVQTTPNHASEIRLPKRTGPSRNQRRATKKIK
jgi:hypothetical protein